MIQQLQHNETHIHNHNLYVSVICHNIKTPDNIGQIFRIADGMGVSTITFCSENNPMPNKTVRKISRSTDKIIPYTHHENTQHVLENMRAEGFYIVALEITANSIPLADLQIPHKKIAILIGNESHGIPDGLLQLCDTITYIPMYGKNSSINVAMSLSICLYKIISTG